MIRHIVTWNFKNGMPDAEKRVCAEKIKTELEKLPAAILRLTMI